MNNTRKPEQGNTDNLFQRLSDYISQFDKTWIERIKPASPESIELLINLSGIRKWNRSFPKSYQIYLEKMGTDDGGFLSSALGAYTDIGTIIEFYQEYSECKPEVFEFPFFLFFSLEMGGGLAFDLSGKNKDAVMEFDGWKFSSFFSESFEKMIFQSAFSHFEKNKYCLTFNASSCFSEIGNSILNKYGFEKAWFSDFNNLIGLKTDVCFETQTAGGVFGRIIGDNKNLIDEIMKFIIKETDSDAEILEKDF